MKHWKAIMLALLEVKKVNKLLRAALYRLKRQKLFWILLAASFICGVIFGIISFFENDLDGLFVAPLFLIMGIYVSLSVGQEYNDATIRNKVIVGHTKGTIFVSELIINAFACLAMMLAFILPAFICCYSILLSNTTMEKMLMTWICLLLASVVYAAIFNLISCLISQKAIGAILCILIVFAMAFGANRLEFSIFQVESITIEQTNELGEIISAEVIPNPSYVDGITRKMYMAVDSLIPNGQVNNLMVYLGSTSTNAEDGGLQIFSEEMLPFYPIYSIGLAIVLSFAGWLAFRTKELQ